MERNLFNYTVGIIGLGYVGLPLAIEFSKKYKVVGFDINESRVNELNKGIDSTKEVTLDELNAVVNNIVYSSNKEELKGCNIYIITVPTPITTNKLPDLTPLLSASKLVGEFISQGDIVIYESTVYPGATEEDCIPVVEEYSGLKFNKDFYAGYSPERINPGDKSRKVKDILKVTSGSTPEISDLIDNLYSSIIEAGTFKASSIKVAEASKVIENVQRDVNISLVNEFHQIFSRLNISTSEVIEAAATKWNFMNLSPGLVGGHCIGVDPYYLLHKSQSSGYIPDLIRTAREINDSMPEFVVQEFLSSLIKKKINPVDVHVLLLGFTFKENCPDFRNTKIVNVYNAMIKLGFKVSIFDPEVDVVMAKKEYGVEVSNKLIENADVAFLAVKHDKILKLLKEKKLPLTHSYIFDYRA